MAVLIANQFTTWQLNEDEEAEGSIFTITQRQVMQNHMASIAIEKLSAAYNTENELESIQKEAYNRGQIDLCMYFLDQSESAIEAKNQQPNS